MIDGQYFVSSPLNELTYCYRATARTAGTSVAVVQGNFSTGRLICVNSITIMYCYVQYATACPPQSLVTDQTTNPSFSNGSLTIPGGLVVYNGTVEDAVATYQCSSGYKLSGNAKRVCRCDGNWNGFIPSCTTSKY